MTALFYINACIAIATTAMVIFSRHAVHALLYLVLSFLCISFSMYLFGAFMAAALEVIVYAGAIMVLFVFVIMLLNIGPNAMQSERMSLSRIAPIMLCVVLLLAELIYVLCSQDANVKYTEVTIREVAVALYTQYSLAIEIASCILLAGLVGAYRLGAKLNEIR